MSDRRQAVNIFTGRTFWLNVAVLPLAHFLAKHGLPLDEDTIDAVTVIVVALANVINRRFVERPARFTAPIAKPIGPGTGVLILSSLVMSAALWACNSVSFAADFAVGCQGWKAATDLAAPYVGTSLAVSVTEAIVGDACTNQAFIDKADAEAVVWIKQATANLKGVLKQ